MDNDATYPRRPVEPMEHFIYGPNLTYEPSLTYDPTLNYEPILGDLAWNIMPPHQAQSISQPEPMPMRQPTSQAQPVAQTLVDIPKDASERGTISPACTACRERHLKCDGVQPACSRCISTTQDCVYVRSRRGHRPTRKKSEPSLKTQSKQPTETDSRRGTLDSTSDQSPSEQEHSLGVHTQIGEKNTQETLGSEERRDMALSHPRLQSKSLAPPLSSEHASAKLQELYYTYFHDAHPILIPKAHFNSFSGTLPASITAVIDYIGACFSDSVDQNRLRDILEATVFSASRQRNGHTVQALLLLAIAQHSTDLAHQACQTLDSAINLALELGMNKNFYRCGCCIDNPILRESWRRTWWELYVIDGMLAAVHQKSSFRLHSQQADLPLPCEESVFKAGPGPVSN